MKKIIKPKAEAEGKPTSDKVNQVEELVKKGGQPDERLKKIMNATSGDKTNHLL